MSANEPDHIIFRGKDLKECEQFIGAVNKHARAEGKLRDDQWIADFVAICLTGDALLWWSVLDEETQTSWKLLRQAMISRFLPLFHGKSGAEAEDFVYQIRQRALDLGKLHDPFWIARFASGCFIGSALRWYTSLDYAVRSNWDLLQSAIFAQYGEEIDEAFLLQFIPTPALAAAAPATTQSRHRGRIRVARKDDSRIYYLSKILGGNQPGRIMVTSVGVEALEVEYEPLGASDAPLTLYIPNGQISELDVLGMKWYLADTTGKVNALALCGVNSSSGIGSPSERFEGPLLTRAWKISQSINDRKTVSVHGISDSGDHLQPVSTATSTRWLWLRRSDASKLRDEIELELFFDQVQRISQSASILVLHSHTLSWFPPAFLR